MEKPLAIKLAPSSLKEIYGQEHLIGKDKVITNMIKNKKIFSMILYGKPGIGKTSIANAMVKDLDIRYRFFNAAINNKHDLDVIVEEAKLYDGIVLIIDEIHRLNKDKQDLLLPQLESGLITLIGLTTSNPYHKINPAIRSRCQIFELKDLNENDILKALKHAVKTEYLKGIQIDTESLKYIAALASNDLRFAYNLLEVCYYSINKKITIEDIKNINNKPVFIYDKNEDGHYDLLSALQKSIRGSDVDASLHYLARLIYAGDLDSIYRRISVICYEDIGLANPSMGPKVNAAINLSELVGLPEATIILGEIVIELALSPKSNSSYSAISNAITDVETGRCDNIPETIKINSKIYKYPHDYPNSFVVQQYLPNNLKNKKYYIPKNSGHESSIKNIYENLEKLKRDFYNK